jgi:DNA primase
LSDYHKRYLQSRNFDPDHLIKTWQLLSAGPVSSLDNIDYKNRIIIPYQWDNQTVSFDSRSISKSASHEKRYKACPKEYEIVDHKNILYGKQEHWNKVGILVEGPTDVWRMGTSSFAVSGIQYTSNQVRVISRIFQRVAVCFDDDPQARIQATKIVAELKFRGVNAFRIDIEGDPGSMKQEDANYLVKQLMK